MSDNNPLLLALEALTKPNIEHHTQKTDTGVYIKIHTTVRPSLLEQMRDLINPSRAPGAGSPSAASTRNLIDADAMYRYGQITSAIGDWCREQGASDVRIAALAVKLHDRCVPGVTAHYVGVEVPDRYVFGYGMDYHEQGRNLPAIYALKD